MNIIANSYDTKPDLRAINGMSNGNGAGLSDHYVHPLSQTYPQGYIPDNSEGRDVYQEDDMVNGDPLDSLADLEQELPMVSDGQVSLGLLMHQLVSDLYSTLSNTAETLGRASDVMKKTKLQSWLSHSYKQVSKLYVLAKWSRNAEAIQKAMNIAAFLRTQGEQMTWAGKALHLVQLDVHRMRIRNADLLTALDVLTTGTYTRLPAIHKEEFTRKKKLSDREVFQVFEQVEDVMRARLLTSDIIPVEMSRWRIESGRTFFTVPQRFECSLIMTGAQRDDVWAFVHVEFLFGVPLGEGKGSREFPRRPPKAFSDDLAFQVRDIIMQSAATGFQPIPAANNARVSPVSPSVSAPYASAVVDAPLVRVYNFLQLLSMTYQLEILIFQAAQLYQFGWKDCMKLSVSPDRRTLSVQYWLRPATAANVGSAPFIATGARNVSTAGGELVISIVTDSHSSSSNGGATSTSASNQPFANQSAYTSTSHSTHSQLSTVPDFQSFRSPVERVKAQIQEKVKLKGGRPSDHVEHYRFDVQWKPKQGSLGVLLNHLDMNSDGLEIDSNCLDFEALLNKVLRRHANAVMARHLENARTSMELFPHPEDVQQVENGDGIAMRIQLAGEQHIVINIELQTGKFLLHESGDLGAAMRGVRWKSCQGRINLDPSILLDLCARVRHAAIMELVEMRCSLLGISTSRHRYLVANSMSKFGKNYGTVYLQLAKFSQHFVTIIIADSGFKFALIEIKEREFGEYHITDFGWVEAEKFLSTGTLAASEGITPAAELSEHPSGPTFGSSELNHKKRKRSIHDVGGPTTDTPTRTVNDPFDISLRQLRDLHAYCRARVAHIFIESQLKARSIPYVHVRSQRLRPVPPSTLAGSKLANSLPTIRQSIGEGHNIQNDKSPLVHHLPVLCVQSSDMLAGAAAAEAAMPNIRIEPMEWWTLDKECTVHTSVQLKYVQPLDGAKSLGPTDKKEGTLIRPSENISYDTQSSVITFLSRDVNECVGEFLEEWARVSKVVVIARQVSLMPSVKGWKDVRILSFDLQTVEFAYFQDYALSITSVEGSYRLSFSRCARLPSEGSQHIMEVDTPQPKTQPNSLPPSQIQSLPHPPSHLASQSQSMASYSMASQSQSQGEEEEISSDKPDLPRNAHEDTVPFARELLKDDRLGASVFELVSFLRATIGIVEELDKIEEIENTLVDTGIVKGNRFDILIKAAGWWRILYCGTSILATKSNPTYALDVRMINGKFMIADGSVNLQGGKVDKNKDKLTTASSGSSSSSSLLTPIPGVETFTKGVLDGINNGMRQSDGPTDENTPINYGSAVVCGPIDAPYILRGLNERILEVV